jgi:hypothetical protein
MMDELMVGPDSGWGHTIMSSENGEIRAYGGMGVACEAQG